MPASKKNRRQRLIYNLGNGVITDMAGHDPAGIATFSIVGATTGLAQLWLVLPAHLFLIITQSICARIGDVTKKGLATLIREAFGQKIAFFLMLVLSVANIATLGANFAGVGAAFNLLFPQVRTIIFLPLVGLFLWWLVVFKNYQSLYKILLLMSAVFLTYILAGFAARPNWTEVLERVIFPKISWNFGYWTAAVAFLGTTITPFLFLWQVIEEVENHPSVLDTKKEIRHLFLGVLLSVLVTFFIILASAMALYKRGIEVQTAADAALALKPLAGNWASFLFGLGIIGSGFLSAPVITSCTAYSVAEVFGWKEGLKQKISQARGFYAVLTAVFLIGVGIAVTNISPIKALFYSQVMNGTLSPILLIFIMLLAGNSKIMGSYTCDLKTKILGWLTVAVTLGAVLAMILSF